MAVPKAVQDLFVWKTRFLRAQLAAIDRQIADNKREIRRLRLRPDTEQQIESLEHINAGLEEDRKPIQDELDRFNAGSDGKKYNMAKRNIENEIQRLQRESQYHLINGAAALAAAAKLITLEQKAIEAQD